jgi:hypothetical protein
VRDGEAHGGGGYRRWVWGRVGGAVAVPGTQLIENA